jgi:putative membrane protein insertion efficiency factor
MVWLVKLYQIIFSPYVGYTCRFHPSCSEYMIESIKIHGTLKGSLHGVIRILKCNPLFKGGIDLPKKDNQPD